ncbi:hypothetical protein [uncultured Winogradskyella sp.]|uniref:hypothetical protein n=1 Tax=uncultured Winogradskyella sp. TaxID=395353 RepID=UPI0030DC1536|tara:strand:+ start:268 stop:747 length:480 start_codon:yes stop_codon:yes gene_type:complete
MKNELIELKHIELEIVNNRTHHFRSFIDQYFCYKNNYITKSGKANWSKIPWNEYVSIEANKTRDKKLVVEKEHIVPLKVIETKLLELGNKATIESIKIVLDKYVKFATITKIEDKILNDKGLKSKMPNEFYDSEHELYEDLFARYKIAKIELINNKICT